VAGEGAVADVIVHVSEGEQYKVGRIEFHGNTRTHDKVLRRELRVQEGMLLNVAGIKNSVYKVEQLQYFKPDKNDPVEFANVDSEKKTVDLVFKGDEADRTELQVGGGWSQPDGFFGQLSVRTQNFMGRGEAVGVSIQAGGVQSVFDVSYYVPWLLDRPQSVGLQVFKTDYDYTQTDGQRVVSSNNGATLTYGRSFGLFNNVSLAYTFSKQRNQRIYTLFRARSFGRRPVLHFHGQTRRPWSTARTAASQVSAAAAVVHLRQPRTAASSPRAACTWEPRSI
jgi:outer membrane protein insertion porin family